MFSSNTGHLVPLNSYIGMYKNGGLTLCKGSPVKVLICLKDPNKWLILIIIILGVYTRFRYLSDCRATKAQASLQSVCCSHTQSIDVYEDSE